MPIRVPISAARRVADLHDLKQVIIVAWDGERTHIVTYGQNKKECDMAAQGGQRIAQCLGLK